MPPSPLTRGILAVASAGLMGWLTFLPQIAVLANETFGRCHGLPWNFVCSDGRFAGDRPWNDDAGLANLADPFWSRQPRTTCALAGEDERCKRWIGEGRLVPDTPLPATCDSVPGGIFPETLCEDPDGARSGLSLSYFLTTASATAQFYVLSIGPIFSLVLLAQDLEAYAPRRASVALCLVVSAWVLFPVAPVTLLPKTHTFLVGLMIVGAISTIVFEVATMLMLSAKTFLWLVAAPGALAAAVLSVVALGGRHPDFRPWPYLVSCLPLRLETVAVASLTLQPHAVWAVWQGTPFGTERSRARTDKTNE